MFGRIKLVWAHHFFIEKAITSQDSERPCILTRRYRFVCVSTILLCGFSNCLIHICCVVYVIQLQVKFSVASSRSSGNYVSTRLYQVIKYYIEKNEKQNSSEYVIKIGKKYWGLSACKVLLFCKRNMSRYNNIAV